MGPLVVFAYNFPHKKTVDVLLHLFAHGYTVGWVLAADPVPLSIPPPAVRTKITHYVPLHPRTVAERLGARYVVAPHDSQLVEELLSEVRPDLGVIAGARILKGYVISKFRIGIVNLHPGLLPEVRGLDAMLWSIYKDVPLGVTAHLIDESVDAGRLLLREEIPIFADDTLLDLSERLYDYQLKLLAPALEAAMRGDWIPFQGAALPPPNKKMPPELERQVVGKLEEYKKRFALVEGKML